MNVRNTWKEGIDMDTILGLLATAVIGGYLLAKKEPGKIRLLPTPALWEKARSSLFGGAFHYRRRRLNLAPAAGSVRYAEGPAG